MSYDLFIMFDDSDYVSGGRKTSIIPDEEPTHPISPTQVQDEIVDKILIRARESRERLAQMRANRPVGESNSNSPTVESPLTPMIPEGHALAIEPQREIVTVGTGSPDTPRRPGEGSV